MKLKNKIILIVSNEPWGDVWFSKHHYANELSKLGHNVYFINPAKPWRFSSLFSFSVNIKSINPNLKVITYSNNLPTFSYKSIFQKINDYLICYRLNLLFKNNNNLIIWNFDPFRFINIYKLKIKYLIFHIVDRYLINTDPVIAKK